MIEVATVATIALWAASDGVTALSALVGTIVLALGGWVSLRSYQAKRKVDQVSVSVVANEGAIKSMQAALARADSERATRDESHAEQLQALRDQIDSMEERHRLDNERCDDKLRRLGHIVKDLGGEVPDDLNGLHAA